MNKLHYIHALMFILISSGLNAQPWQQNSAIFNPSGVPSLAFSQPRFADLDGDGDLDLIIGSTDDVPFYLENTGNVSAPAYTPGEEIFTEISFLDAEMGVCCDLDNDGDLDFVAGGFTGLNFFQNTGAPISPLFEKIPDFFSGLSVGMNPVPDLADIDNDNDFDMIVGFSESGSIKIYTNTGNPQSAIFSESTSVEIGDVGLYAYPVFHDLDDDGDQDILSGRDEHGFIFYQNEGDPYNAVWEVNNPLFTGLGNDTYWNSPDLADLNGDLKPDLVFGTAAGPLNYYLNTGSPSVPAWQVNTTLFGGVLDVGGASNPYFYDYDGDGDFDLFSGSQMGDIKYYENTGTATGPAWHENSSYFVSLKHSIYGAVAIGDVNNDNLPDAIVGDLNGKLFYHRNTGDGFFLEEAALGWVALGGWSSPRLYDLDGDGDLDIIAGNEAGNLFYLENQGTPENPTWALIAGYFGTIDVGTNCVPAIADVDRDGDADILTGNLWGDIRYFENTGSAWMENPEIFQGLEGEQNTTPAFADLDADGDVDLALGQYSGIFDYYRNDALVTSVYSTQPGTATLITAFPNPFSESTTLAFNLEEAQKVSFQVFDTRGRIVFDETTGFLQPGKNTVAWNAAGFPEGVYFMRIFAGKYQATIKVFHRR